MTVDPAPLDVEAFAALMAPFAPFERPPRLAVAVSGGRDSLALALLAADWVRARSGRLLGLIVDHGLRAGSTAEARDVQALLAARGLAAEILTWDGDKPATGLQEAARAARYRLLRDACRRHRILHLLVGHQADDQAETVLMRDRRGSGPDGLAGMAAMVEWPDLRLLRPVLGVSRARLAATLRARACPWIDDPSNDDPRFERARLRAGGPLAAPLPAAAAARTRHEWRIARAAVDVLEIGAAGEVALDGRALAVLEPEVAAGLLSRVARALGQGTYPPRRARVAVALQRLCNPGPVGSSGRAQDFTLAGCRLMLRPLPDRPLRWIVRAEAGRIGRQPLVAAPYFACGATAASHLE